MPASKKNVPTGTKWLNQKVSFPKGRSRRLVVTVTVASIVFYVFIEHIATRIPNDMWLAYPMYLQYKYKYFELVALLALWMAYFVRPTLFDSLNLELRSKTIPNKVPVHPVKLIWRAYVAEVLAIIFAIPVAFEAGLSAYGDPCSGNSYTPCSPLTTFGPWAAKIVFSVCTVLFGYLLIRRLKYKQNKALVGLACISLLLLGNLIAASTIVIIGDAYSPAYRAGNFTLPEALLVISLYPIFAVVEYVWGSKLIVTKVDKKTPQPQRNKLVGELARHSVISKKVRLRLLTAAIVMVAIALLVKGGTYGYALYNQQQNFEYARGLLTSFQTSVHDKLGDSLVSSKENDVCFVNTDAESPDPDIKLHCEVQIEGAVDRFKTSQNQTPGQLTAPIISGIARTVLQNAGFSAKPHYVSYFDQGVSDGMISAQAFYQKAGQPLICTVFVQGPIPFGFSNIVNVSKGQLFYSLACEQRTSRKFFPFRHFYENTY